MKKTVLSLAALSLSALGANAAIILPSYLPGDSTANAFNTPADTVDQSGLGAAVNSGDSLASAQAVTHSFDGGYTESYVSNSSGSDYFAAGVIPTLVYDLGTDAILGDLVLWQYQNNGGAGGTNIGNHVRTIELRYHTNAEGSSFDLGGADAAAEDTVSLQSVLGLGGTNSAQTLGLSGVTARFVALTLTDNHAGDPDGEGVTGGGDRVGIGEIRFNAIPEPGAFSLLGLAGLGLMLRRRR